MKTDEKQNTHRIFFDLILILNDIFNCVFQDISKYLDLDQDFNEIGKMLSLV